jgi:signal transduction histidine kinase
MALLLVGAVSLVSYQNAKQLMESSRQVRHTNAVLQSLTDISTSLIEAESGRWRYRLLQDQQDLERSRQSIADLNLQTNQLQTSLSGVATQQQDISLLTQLVAEQISLLQESLTSPESESDVQSVLFAQLKENRDDIHQVIRELRATEQALLQAQMDDSRANLQSRMIIEIIGTALTFIILAGVYALLYQQMLKRQQAEDLQRRLEQQKELSEMKLQFFSMVSHEFRTPLSLILGSAQLLADNLKPVLEPTKLKNLSRIQLAAKSMVQLLNDMLTLARADAGRLEFNPNWVEIQTFCLNLIEEVEVFHLSQRSIQLSQQGAATHAWIDEKLLYSTLSNLLSNAIKYSAPDSTVSFILQCHPDHIMFQIKDQGIGIPPEDLARLYDPFSRGRNARAILGTGLGLAIVKKCLDAHQGKISVESQVGKGSTFTVTIPQPPIPSTLTKPEIAAQSIR